jgi:Domain of unknown function (DUF4268)
MYEALCRPFGTTLDIVHDEGGPPITPRTWGLDEKHWKRFSIGRTGFSISSLISTRGNHVRVALRLPPDPQKFAFQALRGQQAALEAEFGESLEWLELPGRNASRIAIFKVSVDPAQKAQYPELHRWMLEKMDRFRAVFAARVREISIVPALDAPDEESPEE